MKPDQIELSIKDIQLKLAKLHHAIVQFDADFVSLINEFHKLYSELANDSQRTNCGLFDFHTMSHIYGIANRLSLIISDPNYAVMIGTFDLHGKDFKDKALHLAKEITKNHGPFSCGCSECALHPANLLVKNQQNLLSSKLN